MLTWYCEQEVSCDHVQALRVTQSGILVHECDQDFLQSIVALLRIVIVLACQRSWDVFQNRIDFSRIFVLLEAEVVLVCVRLHDGVGVGKLHPDGMSKGHGDSGDDEAGQGFEFLFASVGKSVLSGSLADGRRYSRISLMPPSTRAHQFATSRFFTRLLSRLHQFYQELIPLRFLRILSRLRQRWR